MFSHGCNPVNETERIKFYFWHFAFLVSFCEQPWVFVTYSYSMGGRDVCYLLSVTSRWHFHVSIIKRTIRLVLPLLRNIQNYSRTVTAARLFRFVSITTEIAKLLDFRSNPGLTSQVSELEIGSNNCPSGAFRSDPLETWSDNTKTRVLLELFPKFQGQASEYFDWLYSIPLPTIILKPPSYL